MQRERNPSPATTNAVFNIPSSYIIHLFLLCKQAFREKALFLYFAFFCLYRESINKLTYFEGIIFFFVQNSKIIKKILTCVSTTYRPRREGYLNHLYSGRHSDFFIKTDNSNLYQSCFTVYCFSYKSNSQGKKTDIQKYSNYRYR